MPVTARLSRKFYDRFGDDIANELVNWFNAVDATYQASLKELNELNFARFDKRVAEFGKSVDDRFAEAKVDLAERLGSFQSKMLMWMVGLWFAAILAFAGMYFALARLR